MLLDDKLFDEFLRRLNQDYFRQCQGNEKFVAESFLEELSQVGLR